MIDWLTMIILNLCIVQLFHVLQSASPFLFAELPASLTDFWNLATAIAQFRVPSEWNPPFFKFGWSFNTVSAFLWHWYICFSLAICLPSTCLAAQCPDLVSPLDLAGEDLVPLTWMAQLKLGLRPESITGGGPQALSPSAAGGRSETRLRCVAVLFSTTSSRAFTSDTSSTLSLRCHFIPALTPRMIE